MPALFKFHGILTTKDMPKKGQMVVRYAYIRWSENMLISGSGQQAKVHKKQTFLPLKAEWQGMPANF